MFLFVAAVIAAAGAVIFIVADLLAHVEGPRAPTVIVTAVAFALGLLLFITSVGCDVRACRAPQHESGADCRKVERHRWDNLPAEPPITVCDLRCER